VDLRVSVGAITSNSQPVNFTTGPAVSGVSPGVLDVGTVGPTWTIDGSGFSGATDVGFYSGTVRVFHLSASEFGVSSDGSQITTNPIQAAGIENILHSTLGDQPSYLLDVRVSVGCRHEPDERERPSHLRWTPSHGRDSIDRQPQRAPGSSIHDHRIRSDRRHLGRFLQRVDTPVPPARKPADRERRRHPDHHDPRKRRGHRSFPPSRVGRPPYTVDLRVSVGAITSNSQPVTFTTGPVVSDLEAHGSVWKPN
jgi:hypothetical protein